MNVTERVGAPTCVLQQQLGDVQVSVDQRVLQGADAVHGGLQVRGGAVGQQGLHRRLRAVVTRLVQRRPADVVWSKQKQCKWAFRQR